MNVEQRLAKLERQNRRWKWGAVACLLVAAVGVAMGAVKRDDGHVFEGRGFVLYDADGKLRGSFGINNSGEPMLTFYDHDEKPRALFGFVADNDQSMIAFRDNDGKLEPVAASKVGRNAKTDK